MPTPKQLAQIAGALSAPYEKVPAGDGDYAMNHSVEVYLVNRDGQLTGQTFFGDYPEQRLALMRRAIGHE